MAGQPHFRLTYLSFGAIEPVRLAFSIANVEVEYNKVEKDHWEKLKSMGATTCVLDINDDIQVTQGVSILRFAGKLARLYPVEAHWSLWVDEMLDFLRDLRAQMIPFFSSKNRGREFDIFIEDTLPNLLTKIENQLIANDTGYCVGKNLTVADLELAALVRWITHTNTDDVPHSLMDQFTIMSNIESKVYAHPNLIGRKGESKSINKDPGSKSRALTEVSTSGHSRTTSDPTARQRQPTRETHLTAATSGSRDTGARVASDRKTRSHSQARSQSQAARGDASSREPSRLRGKPPPRSKAQIGSPHSPGGSSRPIQVTSSLTSEGLHRSRRKDK
eukprot:GEMP01034939.1.p1 GENE.GEMP01034939.1~~GEMP01034939.1.p1  ORF type:complete len:344 (+),score=49.99 GEMP01034939.1:36-1034(+)